jgi:hypothetical protein
MSKRFPIPEFDRDQYKNMKWTPPRLLSADEQATLVAGAKAGDSKAVGCHAVEAGAAFYDRFKLQGPHRHAVMCVLPRAQVKLVGRSWAWSIQRALMVDTLDAEKATVLHDWKTPRPMNTRLGPDNGVTLDGGIVYAVFGHQYSDHWISNKTLNDVKGVPPGKGFNVVSASDQEDFHACNLFFSWT